MGRRTGVIVGVAWLVVVGGCAGGGGDGASVKWPDGGGSVDLSAPALGCGGGCPAGRVCDEERQRCVGCLADDGCAEGAVCEDDECRSVICADGEGACPDGETVARCVGRGTRWESAPCADGEICAEGACRAPLCEPGATRCQGGLLMTCGPRGVSETPGSCAEGELCVGDRGCLPVAHDLVLVADTSGSMNRAPESAGSTEWPEAWPLCEPQDDPTSRIGIVRRLFRRLMSEENDLFARSHFVMMRFPQRASGLFVEDPGAPARQACRAGFWQEVEGHALEGDDGSHHSGGEDDWFAASAWQAVLVPDPRDPAPAATPPDERIEAIGRWLDGVEAAAPGADALACSDRDALSVCGAERPCLGPEGAKTCHDVTEPELRADGGTPLGRSLFYAAEYLRRFVHVDGRACAGDGDCGSLGYECVEGACVDPLGTCRKAVIVLLTDGVESPVPEDAFFRALVQAKRLHFGLGCERDEDCLSGASCGEAGTCVTGALLAAARSDVECEADADCPTGLVCGGAEAEEPGRCHDAELEEVLSYVDPEGVQRVTTASGRALPMTVHVVDVAGGAVENRRLALLGGGVLITRSLMELDALIADLASVFDVKVGAQCLGL